MESYKYLPNFPLLLSVDNTAYCDFLLKLKNLNLDFDSTGFDRETHLVSSNLVQANIILKTDSTVISGLEEIQYLFGEIFDFNCLVKSGTKTDSGTIMTINGKHDDILRYERFILDLVTVMSATSTYTSKFVSILEPFGRNIAATRKSILSPILKKAVYLGGGLTHRVNQFHALIIKDNYKTKTISEFFLLINNLSSNEVDFVEFEVESIEELKLTIEFIVNTNSTIKFGIMLDNFSPKMLKMASELIMSYPKIFFVEMSGGVTLENVESLIYDGIDFYSSSELFRPKSSPDFSLELLRK